MIFLIDKILIGTLTASLAFNPMSYQPATLQKTHFEKYCSVEKTSISKNKDDLKDVLVWKPINLTKVTVSEKHNLKENDVSNVISFLQDKIGYPYSKSLRNSGNAFDCSSLAYYAWASNGVDISRNGSYTAAEEAKNAEEKGWKIADTISSTDFLKAGDLLFYHFDAKNGRFKNIDHVATYIGDGMVIDASLSHGSVVKRNVYALSNIVEVARPMRGENTLKTRAIKQNVVTTKASLLQSDLKVSKKSYSMDYGYSLLKNDTEQGIYQALDEECKAFSKSKKNASEKKTPDGDTIYSGPTIQINQVISKERLKKTIVSFLYDNPEYFWTLGYSYFYNDEHNFATKILLHCDERYANGEKRYVVKEKIENAVCEYMKFVPEKGTEEEKEIAIHDAIINHTSYGKEDERSAHTIEGVLIDKVAVCEGYAKTFSLLLKKAGIKNNYVIGSSRNVTHAWNQVCINDKWYNVDITWNDMSDDNRSYFNLGDKDFYEDHIAAINSEKIVVGGWSYDLKKCEKKEIKEDNPEFSFNLLKANKCLVSIFDEDGNLLNEKNALNKGDKVFVKVLTEETNNPITIYIKDNGEVKKWEGVWSQDLVFPFTVDKKHDIEVSAYTPVQTIKTNLSDIEAELGTSYQAKATVFPKTADNKTITWKTSNSDVAEISTQGKIKIIGVGKTMITAYAENGIVKDSFTISVKTPCIKGKSRYKLNERGTFSVNGYSKKIIWKSSNKKVASISQKGKLVAKKKGKTMITAKCGKITIKKKIIVKVTC